MKWHLLDEEACGFISLTGASCPRNSISLAFSTFNALKIKQPHYNLCRKEFDVLIIIGNHSNRILSIKDLQRKWITNKPRTEPPNYNCFGMWALSRWRGALSNFVWDAI